MDVPQDTLDRYQDLRDIVGECDRNTNVRDKQGDENICLV